MPRPNRFINFGIDHGTSNSAIAVMEPTGPRIISPGGAELTMPSVVYVCSNGRLLVGAEARQAMRAGVPEGGDGYASYKPQIGQGERHHFRGSNRVMTVPEIASKVLMELLRAYREDTNQSPRAGVIAVPATFKQTEREGTRQAARLAGLEHVELLPEPVAAAIACGFTADRDARAQWLVFDLGAGTLDVSLVVVRDGDLMVPEKGNEGDNGLGSTRFDRDLLDFVLGPARSDPSYRSIMERNNRLQSDYAPLRRLYQLESFGRESNPQAWGSFLIAVEEAKIELSTKEEAQVRIDSGLITDETGKTVTASIRITRSAYEQIIGPHVERAVDVCQSLLRRNQLKAGDISGLILIGRPTKTPYIQSVLRERLNIDLQNTIDPVTAVAQGAAIYGATREIPRNLRPGRSTGKSIQLTLEYEPAAKIPMLFVAGQVAGASAADRGLSVEFNRTDGLWKSGPIRVDADGFFTAELTLIDCGERTFSSFETILRNAEGSIIDRLDEPGVWYPLGETVMTLPSSFRVALHDNKSSVLVSAGSMLPVEVEMGPFYTIKDLAKGSNEDVLRIPIMEGVTDYFGDENERADSNLHIGTLVIEGNEAKVTRNVPAGAKVVINILVDVSQEITVVARVPVLREEFAATFHCEPAELPVEAVRLRFERLKAKLDRVRDLERRKPQEGVASLLERLDRMECVAQIEKQVGRAEGSEPGARQSAHEQVLRLAGTLHSIGKKQRRANIEDLIEGLEPCCKGELTAKLADLRSDFESASDDDNRALQRIESLLLALEQKARRGLCTDLLLDLMASRGRKATAKQGAIVHRAEKLAEQFFVSGAGDDLSADELVEMNRIHEQLLEAYPELRAWREDNLRKSIDDASLALIESHIRSET